MPCLGRLSMSTLLMSHAVRVAVCTSSCASLSSLLVTR